MHRKTWFLLTQHMYLDLLTTICLILLLGYYSVHDVHVLLSNLNLGSIVLLCIVDQFYRYFIPVKTISFTLYLTSYNPPPPLFSLSPPSERVKVVVTQGDITDYSSVLEVSKGADLVIHTASLVDVWHRVPETVIQAVNVQGKGSDTAIAFTG